MENIKLDSNFTTHNAVTPSKIFVRADSFFVNAAFLGGAEEEALDFDCIFDSGSLIKPLAEKEVLLALTYRPYFVLSEKMMTIELKNVMALRRDTFSYLEAERVLCAMTHSLTEPVPCEGRFSLKINKSLAKEKDDLTGRKVKPTFELAKRVLNKMMEHIPGLTDFLRQPEGDCPDPEWQVNEELTQKVLDLKESFFKMTMNVSGSETKIRSLYHFGKVEEKCEKCQTLISSTCYSTLNTIDKRRVELDVLCFACTKGKRIKI